ncbi:MAG: beta-ketoacyl synthase N-terminal-like domain-containing protein, partial [Nitrospirota bacterium]
MGGSPIDAHRLKNSRRVVVTGMAAITPMATGVEQSWSALQRGVSPIKLVTRFDTSHMRT